MEFETILLEIKDGVARLTLNRPDRLNSFTVQMHDEASRALEAVAKSDARVLVLTGAGRGFCAGQDLSDRAVAPGGDGVDLGESLEKRYNPLVRRLASLDMPVICAVNGVAAGAVGIIRACLDESVKYSFERKTFGKPIAEYQLIQQMIARMQQNLDAGELLVWKAGMLKNQGMRNTRETSMAKWFCTDAARQAADDAVQIHGAYGYSDEYNVERHLRNTKSAVIYEGTSQIHTLLQASYVLGWREDKPVRCPLPAYDADVWMAE